MFRLRNLGYSFLALLILSSMAFAFVPQKASAQTVGDFGLQIVNDQAQVDQSKFIVRWLDAAHIELISATNPSISFIATPDNDDGQNSRLYDQRRRGIRADYSIEGWPCTDPSFSIAFDAPPDENTPLTTVILEDMRFRETGIGSCVRTNVSSLTVTAQNPELSVAYFRRVTDTQIERADGAYTYTNSQGEPNVYTLGGRTNPCTNRLVVDGNLVKYYAFGESENKYSGDTSADAPGARTSCNYRKDGDNTTDVEDDFIRNNFAMTLAPSNENIEPGGGDGGFDDEQNPSCESIGGGGSLSWVACPLINIADNTTSFLDNQVVSLLQVPKSDYENPELKATWERIRNVALIILVPIMLIMVISTALGFNFVDAYTIKKSLPRLVVAVMFIVLSWWITTFLLDLTNDVGKGILGLMTSAFGGPDSLTLRSLFDANVIEGIASGAALAGGAGIFLYILATGGGLGVVLSFGFTTLLSLFLVFLVLTIRQMLLIALTLFAPLAILAWIFPGNDKLWKLWWETFSKLLLMFPIIMILIGSGRIFAAVIGSTGGTLINTLLKLIAYIAPFFFIPATFKIAGGLFATLSGVVNDRGKGLFDRNKKYRQKATGQAWHRTGGQAILQKRANTSRRLEAYGSGENRGYVGKKLARTGAKLAGGYNIEALMSARNAEAAKEFRDQTNTGQDADYRGLMAAASYRAAQQDWGAAETAGQARISNGRRQYRSIGGAWVDEANVVNGIKRHGKNRFIQQEALSYEMGKAASEDEVRSISENYSAVASALGMTEDEATGNWIGAAFANQNQHLEFKHTRWGDGEINDGHTMGAVTGSNFVKEIYEKKGSYPLAQMSSNTIERLKQVYEDPDTDIDTRERIAGIAQTFMHDLSMPTPGSAGDPSVVGPPPSAPVGPVDPSSTPESRRRASTPGAAHVAERVRELAVLTGVYAAEPTGPYTAPTHAPTPNDRNQT